MAGHVACQDTQESGRRSSVRLHDQQMVRLRTLLFNWTISLIFGERQAVDFLNIVIVKLYDNSSLCGYYFVLNHRLKKV